MEALTLWVVQRVAAMPREHKFSLGEMLVKTCVTITGLLIDATFTREKQAMLIEASRALTRSGVLVRILHQLRLLSNQQREFYSHESTEIGRMIGGWTRAMQQR